MMLLPFLELSREDRESILSLGLTTRSSIMMASGRKRIECLTFYPRQQWRRRGSSPMMLAVVSPRLSGDSVGLMVTVL